MYLNFQCITRQKAVSKAARRIQSPRKGIMSMSITIYKFGTRLGFTRNLFFAEDKAGPRWDIDLYEILPIIPLGRRRQIN